MTSIEIQDLAAKGANLEVDTKLCSFPELKQLADLATKTNGHLTIREACYLTTSELEAIIYKNQKNVTLDLRIPSIQKY